VRPFEVSARVPAPIEQVFALLDEPAAHEQFNDHYLVDWSTFGPPRGLGAGVRIRTTMSKRDFAEVTVIERDEPTRIVEESVAVGSRRRSHGTFTLEPIGPDATRVTFRLEATATPMRERPFGPLLRMWLTRQTQRAMLRLADVFAAADSRTSRG
jgi:uncharacterized protein YndB with AHSA1/START domain